MYSLKFKDSEYTIPKENLKAFALFEAMRRGVQKGNIHDEETAKEYLESIGFECSLQKQEPLMEAPKVADWYNPQHRELYRKLFYQRMNRELTDEELDFCKDMYHAEEYACGLDG